MSNKSFVGCPKPRTNFDRILLRRSPVQFDMATLQSERVLQAQQEELAAIHIGCDDTESGVASTPPETAIVVLQGSEDCDLTALTGMHTLHVRLMGCVALSRFQECHALSTLRIEGPLTTPLDLRPLTELPVLECLDLTNVLLGGGGFDPVHGLLWPLASCPALRELHLTHCRDELDESGEIDEEMGLWCIDGLFGAQSLQILSIDGLSGDHECLGALTKCPALTTLALCCPDGPVEIVPLMLCQQLTELALAGGFTADCVRGNLSGHNQLKCVSLAVGDHQTGLDAEQWEEVLLTDVQPAPSPQEYAKARADFLLNLANKNPPETPK